MLTGLEGLVKVALAMSAQGPYRTPAAAHLTPAPAPRSPGMGLKGKMLGIGAMGALGVGAGLLHQHNQDVAQYPQVAPAMTGVY